MHGFLGLDSLLLSGGIISPPRVTVGLHEIDISTTAFSGCMVRHETQHLVKSRLVLARRTADKSAMSSEWKERDSYAASGRYLCMGIYREDVVGAKPLLGVGGGQGGQQLLTGTGRTPRSRIPFGSAPASASKAHAASRKPAGSYASPSVAP